MSPDYSNCGTKTANRLSGRRARQSIRRNSTPRGGSPRIRVGLGLAAVPPTAEGAQAPSIRMLQRLYRSSGLSRPRRKGGESPIGRSTAPHNIWEVDAKENLFLTDGRPACYLTIGDEHTGAWLEAVVFPPQEYQPSSAQGGPRRAVQDIRAAQQAGQLQGGQRGDLWLAIK